jgi:hypothetical protein
MIELAKETLIPIRDVPRRLPPRPNGKRVHISAVYRWTQRGIRGLVLEAVRIGGTTYTSCEALQRFAQELSAAESLNHGAGASRPRRRQELDTMRRRLTETLGQKPVVAVPKP